MTIPCRRERTSSFAVVNDSSCGRRRRVVHELCPSPRCWAIELRGTPSLAWMVAFGALDRSEHKDVGHRLELAQLAGDGGWRLGSATRVLLLVPLLVGCVA
jgi:hypothetical protein